MAVDQGGHEELAAAVDCFCRTGLLACLLLAFYQRSPCHGVSARCAKRRGESRRGRHECPRHIDGPNRPIRKHLYVARFQHSVGSVEGQDAGIREDHDATMWVPASPLTARATCSAEVMIDSAPPLSTKSIAASIFGPIDPGGNSPASRYWRACPAVMVSSHR